MSDDFEFDPSGTNPDNKVVGEQHVLSPPDWMDFYFIIPKFAPFFKESIKVVHQNTGRELVEGQDYHLTHRFRDATLSTAKPVFGSITLLDKDITGAASITYQIIGGIWMIDEGKRIETLTDTKLNPRITTWEEIAGLPAAFPPIDHDWNLDDLIGMSDVRDAILAINGTLGGSQSVGESHLNRTDNPHNVSKAQVGLGNVDNLSLANQTEAESGTRNDRFMTPLRTKQLLTVEIGQDLSDHIGRTDNPHNLTKAQFGLDKVDNFQTASITEAVEAIKTDRFMTPQTTGAAIQQRVGNTLEEHTLSVDNPHEVTKTQVGLGNVENLQIASEVEARAGTRNDRYMTPLRAQQLMEETVGVNLSDHAGATDNPHSVTKNQVGLGSVDNFQTATIDEALSNNPRADRFMTPQSTLRVINTRAVEPFNAHLSDTSNPHNVTKSQVGLGVVENLPLSTRGEAEQGTRNDRYMTPLRVKEAISVQTTAVVDGHASRTDNPHGVSATQAGAYTTFEVDSLLADKLDANATAQNSLLFDGRSFNQASTEIINTVTKADVGLGNVDNTADADKPVSTAQQAVLDTKVAFSDVIDNLISISTNRPLSANQGRVLKGLIDDISLVISSDDATLDEFQEVVDFIKANRDTLDSLGISNIAGLTAALDSKVDKVAGMGLTTNDFTTALKGKLDNIEAGAEVNVGTDLGISGSGNNLTVTSSTGGNVLIPIASTIDAGLFSIEDKQKLDGIEEGAGPTDPTNLSIGGNGNARTVDSSTGSNANLPLATTTDAGLMSTNHVSKLNDLEQQLNTLINDTTASFDAAATSL